MNIKCFTQSISDHFGWGQFNFIHQDLGQWLVQSYISLQLPRPVIPFVQFTVVSGRREQFDLSANPSVSKVHSFSLFPVSRAEAPLPCKIPLYNPDSQSYLDEINPQSTQLTQFTLYATRQLSSLAWASLEPMPFGIVASIDAS